MSPVNGRAGLLWYFDTDGADLRFWQCLWGELGLLGKHIERGERYLASRQEVDSKVAAGRKLCKARSVMDRVLLSQAHHAGVATDHLRKWWWCAL